MPHSDLSLLLVSVLTEHIKWFRGLDSFNQIHHHRKATLALVCNTEMMLRLMCLGNLLISYIQSLAFRCIVTDVAIRVNINSETATFVLI